MKQLKLLLALVVSLFGMSSYAQNGSAVGEGQFFLYNVASEAYLTGQNNWGTHASVGPQGLYCTLTVSGEGYSIKTGTNANQWLGTNGFVDAGSTAWIFTPVEGKTNTYYISNSGFGGYLESEDGNTNLHANSSQPTDEHGEWKLFTREDLWNALDLSTASEDNPIDVSFMIGSSTFVRNCDGYAGNISEVTNNQGKIGAWTVTASGNNIVISGPNAGEGQTNDGCEFWNNTFDINQTISVPNGKYIVGFDGFGSTHTVLYGNDVEAAFTNTGAVNGDNFPNALINISSYTGNKTGIITVGDGTLKLGVKRTQNSGGEWTVIDNAHLYYCGTAGLDDFISAYETALAAAQGVNQEAKMNTTTLANLQSALSTYGSGVDHNSQEALSTATTALSNAASAALASIAAYAGADIAGYMAKMGGVLDLTNVYTQDAYNLWYANVPTAYENGEIPDDIVGTLTENGAYNGGWRSANRLDEVLLSAWTIGGNTVSDYNDPLYINTWSTEGNTDGSDMTTPFFEYFGGEGSSIAATTIQATIPGLNPKKAYKVTALVRVRATTADATPLANGVTFTAGDGEAVNASDGTKSSNEPRMYYKTVEAVGKPDIVISETVGSLTIKFTVKDGNLIHWLAFKNVKYEELDVTQEMIDELYASITKPNCWPHNVLLDDAVATTKAKVDVSKSAEDFAAFTAAVNAVKASADEYAQVGAALAEVEAIYATLIGLPSEEDTQYKAIMTLAKLAQAAGEIESQTDPRINSCPKALTLLDQGIRRLVIQQKAEGADVSRGFKNLSCEEGTTPWYIAAGTNYGPAFNTWSTEDDPSGMKTPFLQCWRGGGDGVGLEDVTVAYDCGDQTLGGETVHLYPNSVYEVPGFIRALKEYGANDGVTGLYIYAGEWEQALDEAAEGTLGEYNNHSDLYGHFSVKGATDAQGHLTFGIRAESTTTNWFAFKDFTIKYVSDNVDDLYKDAYEKMLAKAQADIADEANANIGGAAKAALASEIANESNVPGTITYKDGYDQLKAADEAFLAAKEVWDDFAAAISEATTANETYNDAALATEITTAQNLKASDSATNSDATEEAATLRAAIETAKQLYIAKEKYYALYDAIEASCVDTEGDVYTDADGALATLTTAMSDTKAVVDAATTIAAVEENYETLRAAGVTFVNAVDIHFEKYFDVTWVMVNPDFDTVEGQDNRWWNQTDNSTVIDGWTFTNSGNQYVRNAWNNCEAYECDFDIHQTITGMPVGFYELHVSAFQRRGSSAAVYEAYINNYEGDYANRKVSSVIYLNEEETTIKCICDEHSDALIYTGTSTFGQEGDVQPAENFWIPNGMDGSNAWFAQGYYDNKVYVKVPDGNLTVGFKSGTDGYQGGDWTIFDNFRLYFYGSSLTIEMSEDETTNLLAMENQHVKLTRTITASTGENISYNTLVLPFDVTAEKLQAAFGSDVKVYAYKGNEGNSVKFENATTISANVPVLLTTSTASTDEPYIFQNVDIKATAGGAVASGLDGTIEFVGTYAAETPMNGKYFFSGSKIYQGTDQSQKMKGTRAYLTDNSGSVNALSLDIDGTEITAIQGIDGTISVPKAIYNLQGQKVTNPVKGGIYIIDGKKVLVK